MTAVKPRREKKPHQVWMTFTVFVKKEGEKHPWYKHGRGPTLTVQGDNHDAAFAAGEREIARIMAERFKLVEVKP